MMTTTANQLKTLWTGPTHDDRYTLTIYKLDGELFARLNPIPGKSRMPVSMRNVFPIAEEVRYVDNDALEGLVYGRRPDLSWDLSMVLIGACYQYHTERLAEEAEAAFDNY